MADLKNKRGRLQGKAPVRAPGQKKPANTPNITAPARRGNNAAPITGDDSTPRGVSSPGSASGERDAPGPKRKVPKKRPQIVDRQRAEIITQPSTRVLTQWSPRQLHALEMSADGGDLTRLADLCDQMMADDRFGTLLEVLAEMVLGCELTFEKDSSTIVGNADKALELKEDWERAYSRDELTVFLMWSALLGIAFGRHEHWTETESGRVVPRFRCWHPKHFKYDWQNRTWCVHVNGVAKPITAGDGEWVIMTRRGEYRPWANGLWRGIARWWLLKQYAISDWGIHSEKSSKLVLKCDDTIAMGDRRALADELFAAAKDSVISLPAGFSLELVELNANTRDIYLAQIEAAEMAASIAVLGQNLSSRVDGGSYAAAETHAKKEAARVRYLSGALSGVLRDQSLSWWAEYNFNDDKLAPFPKWHTDPPEDRAERATTLSSLATALKTLGEAGYRLPLDEIEEIYGIQLEELSPEDQKAAIDAKQPTPQAPPPITGDDDPRVHAIKAKAEALGSGGKVLPFGKKPVGKQPGDDKDKKLAAALKNATMAADADRFTLAAKVPGFVAGQLYVDALTDAGTAELSEACEGFVGRLIAAVDGTGDYDEARSAILRAFADEPDPDKLAEILEAGIVMAQLAGRHSAQQDREQENDNALALESPDEVAAT